MALVVGQEFAGYRVVRKLGAGGMGEVYLVQHPRLPRSDALKVLPADLSADESFRRRFTREADLAASLDHPNIVDVYDRGEFDGQLWITMRYIEGTDAAELLAPHPRGLAVADVEQITEAVADALDHAHARNLLHRDVKPANILLSDPSGPSRRRRVLLADFGIARPIFDNTRLTATNLTVGSFAYSSPEQLAGDTLDGRADQYSLACTTYQLLSGATPFESSSAPALIRSQLSTPPPPVTARRPDLPSRVDQVLARAMDKQPDRRYASCSDFAADLRAALAANAAPPTVAPPAYTPPAPAPGAQAAPNLAKNPGSQSTSSGAHTGYAPPQQPEHSPLPPVSPGVTPAPYSATPNVVPHPAAAPYPPGYPSAPGIAGFAPADPKIKNYATWALVCGLVSFFAVCLIVPGFVTAGLAIYLGLKSIGMSNARPDLPPSARFRGVAISGVVLGGIGLLWNIAIVIAAIADTV
ncbi:MULTISPECIES: protein kinase domain-containing protein [unclassified Gordonia (in: high G+C Gram-positive bacteria)]|uniref:protein kinase domain-containing protein n=1 Tax=Gordonia sp. VNQ95 TaxID=3156619 RepID=UPI0032B3AE63